MLLLRRTRVAVPFDGPTTGGRCKTEEFDPLRRRRNQSKGGTADWTHRHKVILRKMGVWNSSRTSPASAFSAAPPPPPPPTTGTTTAPGLPNFPWTLDAFMPIHVGFSAWTSHSVHFGREKHAEGDNDDKGSGVRTGG